MQQLRSELRDTLLNNLASRTAINTTEEGSIAVSIVDSFVDLVMPLYRELERIQQEAYLSTSTGVYTELIADLVDIKKRPGEAPADFKLRASQAVHSHVKGNLISIQTAIWGVPGVASFDIKRYGQGTGSFTVYVYPQQNVNQATILNNVRNAVSAVVAEGIRFEIKAPEEVAIDLEIIIQFNQSISVMQRQDLRNRARNLIVRYINQLSPGATLQMNTIIQQVMSSNTNIVDLSISNLKVRGVSVPVNNVFPEENNRFAAGKITVV